MTLSRESLKKISAGVGLAALAVTLATAPASAQGLFNSWMNFGSSSSSWGSWGGESGKHIVNFRSKYRPGTIIVSFGDRRLYYVLRKRRAISYPIAVPNEKARWAGVDRISAKRVNPQWTPTPEMRKENPNLPLVVPGGHPRNPLGVRALYIGKTLYRIHGTDAPWLIGKAVSKGCVRMYNADVVDLYNRTRIGAPVVITWKRFRG